jgi:GH3 auxin-responsive promoter
MNLWCGVALRIWGWSCRPELARFRRALNDPAGAQRGVLERILRQAEGSAFATHHRLHRGLSPEEFAQRVAVLEPHQLEPWVARITAGEPRVLTTSAVQRLVPTSGSTGGAKLIPYTNALLREFRSALSAWIAAMHEEHPAVRDGPAYWATSPALDIPERDSAVSVAFAEDRDYLSPLARRLAPAMLAVPPGVARLRGEAWRRATVNSLRECRNIRLLSLWHPGYLQALFADDLPRWPRLALISCWADGPAAVAADELAHRFRGVAFQPKGLLSTEGVISIPLHGGWPLAVRSHFLEFEQDDGTVVRAHQLDRGGLYRPLLTTGGGLWRYRTGDRVRVEGFLERTPSVRFVGRADVVCDVCGEKLAEDFVAQCLSRAGHHGFALLAPSESGYDLFTERGDATLFAECVERELHANPHYAWARQLGQLRALRGIQVELGATARIIRRDQREGKPHTKPRWLDPRPDWREWLRDGS